MPSKSLPAPPPPADASSSRAPSIAAPDGSLAAHNHSRSPSMYSHASRRAQSSQDHASPVPSVPPLPAMPGQRDTPYTPSQQPSYMNDADTHTISSYESSSASHHPRLVSGTTGVVHVNGPARNRDLNTYMSDNTPRRTATNATNATNASNASQSSTNLALPGRRSKTKQGKLNPTRTDYIDSRGLMIRPLTNHERYQLVRQNIGRPQAIVHVLPYPAEMMPSRSFFEKRVVELQVRLPRLYARPMDYYTNHPSFEPGEGPYAPDAIISEGTFQTLPFDHGEEMATILRHEIDVFESYNFHDRTQPYWSVRLLYGPDECTRAYLVACFNHLIVDPRGALRLVHALTMNSIEALVAEPFETPTRLDDTVKIKPSARYLAPMVFRELVLPKLPKILQRKLTKEDPWPGTSVTRSPLTCGWNISWSALPESTVQQLKTQAKYRSVNNVHSMLKTAYVAAMWRVFGPAFNPPLYLLAGTVIDERQPKLGHAFVSGVYNSVVECGVRLSGNERWWGLTGDVATSITSPRSIADGRMTIGILSAIPDPPVDDTSPDFDPRTPSGWEAYFVERATGLTPFRSSLATFNVGTTSLPDEALDWIWAQTASPLGPAIYVNFIGHESGIRMTSSYCDGAAASKFQIDVVHAVWLRVLERVASGDGDKTISELTR